MVSGICWRLQEILNKTPTLFFFQKDSDLPQKPLDDFGGYLELESVSVNGLCTVQEMKGTW